MMFSLILRCGARRASATSLFLAALAGAGVAAQDDESEPAETVTGTVIAGPVEASWVTSHGAMPVARGEFTLHAAGGLARLSIDLEATGRFAVGRDAESAWIVDPVAGPALLVDEDFAGWETVIGLLTGQRFAPEERPDAVEEVQSDGRAALRFRTDSPHGGRDAWTVARDGGALLKAEIRVADGLGGFREVGLRVAAAARIKNAELPSAWALHLGDFEYRLTPKSILRDHEFPAADLRLDPAVRAVARAIADPSAGDPAVTTLEVAEVHTATIRQKVPLAELSRALATILPEVHAVVQTQGIRMLTAPFARYHSFGAEVDLEAGIVVATPVEEQGRVKARTLPGGTVATTWHVGPYHEMRGTHERIMGWLGEHELRATGMPWEIYWTDPGLVTDPAQWRTQIFYPLGGR